MSNLESAKHSSGRRLPVMDREGFRSVVRLLARRHGSQTRAAKALGLTINRGSRASVYFWKLHSGRVGPSVTGRLVAALRRELTHFGEHEAVSRLERSLVGPDGLARLARYRRWLKQELARTPRTEHIGRRLRGWRTAPSRSRELRRHLYADLFNAFDSFLARIGCTAPRAELAYRDVLAPLMRDSATGQIERGASELSPAEMRRYLYHAFAAQRVLLHRPADAVRAMEAAVAAEVREEASKQIHERERRRRQSRAPGRRAPPPRPGWRVTGEPKPKPPERLEVSEMDQRLRVTRASKQWKVLGQYVSAEVDRSRPRRHVLEWLTKVTEPVEEQLPESFRCGPFYLPLTGELKAALEVLDRKKRRRM